MTLARVTLALPSAIARSVVRFLFLPAAQAHPARLETHVPAGVDPTAGPGAEALLTQLGDAEAVLRLDRIEHRVALLECDPLAALAHLASLERTAWALRRIIRRQDRLVLDAILSPDDWQRVYASSTASTGASAPTGTPGTDQIIDDLECAGWALIESASHALPPPLGERLRLKCPPVSAPALAGPLSGAGDCMARLVALYRVWCEQALPGWDATLAAAPAASAATPG